VAHSLLNDLQRCTYGIQQRRVEVAKRMDSPGFAKLESNLCLTSAPTGTVIKLFPNRVRNDLLPSAAHFRAGQNGAVGVVGHEGCPIHASRVPATYCRSDKRVVFRGSARRAECQVCARVRGWQCPPELTMTFGFAIQRFFVPLSQIAHQPQVIHRCVSIGADHFP
jgi:hypothetical protein